MSSDREPGQLRNDPEDLSLDQNWTEIDPDDEIWAGPTSVPPALAAPAPDHLNTHEMNWNAFEQLILAIARRHEGAIQARRYGKPGQAQHGLDVVAFFRDRQPTVYQAKDWATFGSKDLEAAVTRYASGRRPFDAGRMVIAVSSEVRDTATIEKLDELRVRYTAFEIDLWDKQEISALLRSEYEIVSTFFGTATADVFCPGSGPPPVSSERTSIDADAVLRGPIAHLRLTDDVRRAERISEAQPAEAAEILGRVAEQLELHGFGPHAELVREQEAVALRAGGQRAEEAWTRISLGWSQLGAENAIGARTQVHRLSEFADRASPAVVRCANALGVAAGYVMDYAVTIENLASAVDALEWGDLHLAEAALLLAEEAVANRRPEIVIARSELLERLASSMPSDNPGLLAAARLRMCIADCVGDWESLVANARAIYPPLVCALILARHARYLTLETDPVAADVRWSDAIERACLQGLNDDAADWLYSQRTMRMETGILKTWDLNEAHRRAMALRASGRGTVLSEPFSPRERALGYMRAQEWPQALEALQRYLWHSVVVADWTSELDAHDLLGDVFMTTGRADEALRHFIVAGRTKKAEAVVEAFGERPIRLPIDLITARPWERTAAFAFAAAAADLIVDEDGRDWCAAAFAEFVERSYVAAFGSPDPWLGAAKAFGGLAGTSSEEDARRFLEVGEALIPRPPGSYKYTDEAQVFALNAIAHSHDRLREAAIDQLLASLLADQQMAELTLVHADDLLRGDPDRTAAAVVGASSENLHAALALIVSGADTAPCVPLAQRLLADALTPRVHKPGEMHFGTALPGVAHLMSALPDADRAAFAHAMVDFARDVAEPTSNRCEALRAIRNVGRKLPEPTREELFGPLISFARGTEDPGTTGILFNGLDDLLSRFRITIGDESLGAAGLLAAAAVAFSPGQYSDVESAAVRLLYGADEATRNVVAQALALIPVEYLSLPADFLATHPSQSLRALAACIWALRPSEPESIGLQLAQDASPNVRKSLAMALKDEERHESVRRILLEDPRRSIRSIAGARE